ncbi:MAG: DUF748 domain-containing protein [Candidatus Omnitrophica bacterium]|nr:DUF748 domain-containing protein [Candidatus Omnitrophota bacterium]
MMKFLVKSLIVLVGIVLIIYFSLWLYIDVRGNIWVESMLREILGKQITVKKVYFRPLWGLEIEGVKAKDISLQDMVVKIGLIKSLGGRLYLEGVRANGVRFWIYKRKGKLSRIIRYKKCALPFAAVYNPFIARPAFAVSNVVLPSLPLFIKKLQITDSSLVFSDEDIRQIFAFENIKLEATNIDGKLRSKTKLVLNADINDNLTDKRARVVVKGIAFLPHRFIEAEIKVSHIDYFGIARYLPPSWSPENIGLEKAFFSLRVNLKSKEKSLLVTFSLLVNEYKFKTLENPPSSSYYMLKSIMNIFKSHNSEPLVRFSVEIPWDDMNWDNVWQRIKGRLEHLSFKLAGAGIAANIENAIKAPQGEESSGKETVSGPGELLDIVDEIKTGFKKSLSN